ncbi:hypothetical protein E2562_027496 [Oryza meyeriana var. granulata]|uniref:Uncharacterized protein n=1 Tax=Oryza meyeriana var. granulata TaxID=110450 RepID=A0A6G1E1E0_9ORYZ|nr:hypothetical protein E2562_027496 [Oryza meyeriana var. granulata]
MAVVAGVCVVMMAGAGKMQRVEAARMMIVTRRSRRWRVLVVAASNPGAVAVRSLARHPRVVRTGGHKTSQRWRVSGSWRSAGGGMLMPRHGWRDLRPQCDKTRRVT